jgi:hypothetical protein
MRAPAGNRLPDKRNREADTRWRLGSASAPAAGRRESRRINGSAPVAGPLSRLCRRFLRHPPSRRALRSRSWLRHRLRRPGRFRRSRRPWSHPKLRRLGPRFMPRRRLSSRSSSPRLLPPGPCHQPQPVLPPRARRSHRDGRGHQRYAQAAGHRRHRPGSRRRVRIPEHRIEVGQHCRLAVHLQLLIEHASDDRHAAAGLDVADGSPQLQADGVPMYVNAVSESFQKQSDGSWLYANPSTASSSCQGASGPLSMGTHTIRILDLNGRVLAEGSFTLTP